MVDIITTDLAPAPSRNRPSTFSAEMNTFLSKLPTWTAEANDLATDANSNALSAASAKTSAEAAQTAAELAQSEAEAAQTAAAASANATVWSDTYTQPDDTPGYPAGAVVMDPDNGYMLYTSQAGPNNGNQPYSDDGTWWRPTGQGVLDWELGTELGVTFDDPTTGDITESWMEGLTEVASRVTEFGTDVSGNDQVTETFERGGVTIETTTVFNADGSITITKAEA